jgi:hypothetical protein
VVYCLWFIVASRFAFEICYLNFIRPGEQACLPFSLVLAIWFLFLYSLTIAVQAIERTGRAEEE